MKKPFLHALGAVVYIVVIVFIVQTVSSALQSQNGTLVIPMTMLSLFVLSAAVMGYLFLSEPLYLLMENKKQEAITFFAKTVGVFACFVVVFAIISFLTSTPNQNSADAMQTGKLNINVVCESALSYMTFPDGKSADKFVAKCKDGKHPDVIERYKAQLNLGDGANI